MLLLLLLLLQSVAAVAIIATGKIIIAGGSAITATGCVAIVTLVHVLVIVVVDRECDNHSLLDATSGQVLVVLEYLALVYQAELLDRQG